MKFDLVILEEAKNHLHEAYNYYETSQHSLGERFLEIIEQQYKKIENNPQYYSFISDKKDLRFLLVPKFPFVIIFEIKGFRVFIIDVHKTHKNPQTSKG